MCGEELPYAIEALQDEMLLPRRGDRRCPTRDRHLPASWGHRRASASDHKRMIDPSIENDGFSTIVKPIGVLADTRRLRWSGSAMHELLHPLAFVGFADEEVARRI